MNKTAIAKHLEQLGCTVTTDEPMASHTSFRIGGAADVFAVAAPEQVGAVRRFCGEHAIPLTVVGNGSNLLVSDAGIDGVVLQIACQPPQFNGNTVTATAGLPLAKLCLAAWEQGLSGLEFAYGIPGTVGGGVYMNAGAYGGELSQVVRRVGAVDADGAIIELTAEEMNFGYRHSVCMERPLTVLWAQLELQPDDPAAIRARMDDYLSRRREKQPLEYPSGGSFFKRPAGHFAGALIEGCGLKGFTVGGAQVSEKHAGFVINRGGATCADVMELCRQVQQRVWDAHGVRLEREVQFMGREDAVCPFPQR